MALDGVLLDVDGTLVLSVDAHAQAWSAALAEAGHQVPPDRVRPLVGMGGDRVLAALVPGLDDEREPGAGIAERRRRIFLEHHASTLQPAPGARELLERLRAEGLRLIAATSAKEDELEVLLGRAGVDDLIESATTSNDAESSKPAPDIVEAALDHSGMAADRVLMIGDTPYDIESAGRAGVSVIALRCGGFPESTLSAALAIYDDPADLLANYQRSPLAARDTR